MHVKSGTAVDMAFVLMGGALGAPGTCARRGHAATTTKNAVGYLRPKRTARPRAACHEIPSAKSRTQSMSMSLEPARYDIIVEYCPGCQWMLRAVYWSGEILQTFQNESGLRQVSVRPSPVSGTFQIRVCDGRAEDEDAEIVWDRKTDAGFPEVKLLKQRIRAIIAPEKLLGHSEA
ncbi:hypothetical protein FVE85_6478 [Porphyridium purpureum]|uniref:Selenoprotein W n=1 Tax=Porphyridium purpureum TaxID=35688 RepID=A0A5J4Z7T2_PORPP|nr:hypothetical protein FVE85_6478 [Porphyridium purpureum]|eukprot:POR3139..scf295_1